MPSLDSELDAVLKMYAERREKAIQKRTAAHKAKLSKARNDLKAGTGTYNCGPCIPCATSILLERDREMGECLGHP